ncbi:MAG: hypothetical protein GC171_15100 [Terrimonas sp.]|nr:hypothetical protein [Terrimonas sp.]
MKLALVILTGLIAMTAITGGLMLIANPEGTATGLSLSVLENTPFHSFRIPGIILSLLVGGVNFIALLFMILKQKQQYDLSLAGGLILCGWILAQVIILLVFHWLQILYFTIGLFVILLSQAIKGKWMA